MHSRTIKSEVTTAPGDSTSSGEDTSQADTSSLLKPNEIWKLLLAIGLHNHFNFHLRELVWYGLWTNELLSFTDIQSCFVFPQYPVWFFDDKDATASVAVVQSESHSAPPSEQFQQLSIHGSPNKRPEILPFATKVPEGETPSTPTRTAFDTSVSSAGPSGHITFNTPSPSKFLNDEMERRLAAVFSVVREEKEKQLIGDVISEAGNVKETVIPDTHRIPDFGVLHIKYKRDYTIVYPHIRILGVVTPVLVEVKNYKCKNNDHYCFDSELEVSGQLMKAIGSIREQMTYLFSSNTQSAVIGIVAAGHFWAWRHFIKEGDKIVGKSYPQSSVRRLDLNPRKGVLSGPPGWFGVFEVGTEDSYAMLDKIHRWTETFINEPNNTDLDLDI